MNKWFWLGALAFVLGTGGVCWYFDMVKQIELARLPAHLREAAHPAAVPPDDTEPSEPIEPFDVEGAEPPTSEPPVVASAPLPRVVFEAGMQQPPRPDTEGGRILRMPYADEDSARENIVIQPGDTIVVKESIGESITRYLSNLDQAIKPVVRVVQTGLSKLNPFTARQEPAQAEESENKSTEPEDTTPEPDPVDYHRLHPECPYHGGCPYPYYRR